MTEIENSETFWEHDDHDQNNKSDEDKRNAIGKQYSFCDIKTYLNFFFVVFQKEHLKKTEKRKKVISGTVWDLGFIGKIYDAINPGT